MKPALFAIIISILLNGVDTTAQISGNGSLSIDKSVIAGGGALSSGEQFSIYGTTGQSIAGVRSFVPTGDVHSGFWNGGPALPPTAATVDLGGRITTKTGRPIRNAMIVLTDASGAPRSAITNAFGFYNFTGVEVGQTVMITASSKRYIFDEPTIVLNVNDNFDGLDFVGVEIF